MDTPLTKDEQVPSSAGEMQLWVRFQRATTQARIDEMWKRFREAQANAAVVRNADNKLQDKKVVRV